MYRYAFVSFVALFICHMAGAQPLVRSFHWAASGVFTVQAVQDSGEVTFKDSMRDGESKLVKQGDLSADVHSFDGFVTVGIAQDGRDGASLFIFERQNGGYVLLNEQPIPGRAANISKDLTDSLAGAKTANGWDASLALRAMVAYFKNYPNRQLAQFADDMELGRLKAVPRPPTKLARMPQPPVDLGAQDVGPDDDQTAAVAGAGSAPPSQAVNQDPSMPQQPPPGRQMRYGQQLPPPQFSPPSANDDSDEFNDPFYEPNQRVQQQQRPIPPGNIPYPGGYAAPPPRPMRRAQAYRDPYTDQTVPESDPYTGQRRRRLQPRYQQQPPQQPVQFGFPFNIFGGGR